MAGSRLSPGAGHAFLSPEKTSYTAATPSVVNGANSKITKGDEIRVDVDAVHTTAAKGPIVILGFK